MSLAAGALMLAVAAARRVAFRLSNMAHTEAFRYFSLRCFLSQVRGVTPAIFACCFTDIAASVDCVEILKSVTT